MGGNGLPRLETSLRAPFRHLPGLSYLLIFLAAAAPGQTPGDTGTPSWAEERPGYYTVNTRPDRADAALIGPSRLTGVTPLALPGDLLGSYRLEINSYGYEHQRVEIEFPGNAGPVELSSPRPTGAGGIVKAVAWPGLAELTGGQGDAYRGAGFALAGGVGVIGLIAAEVRRSSAEDDLGASNEATGGDPNERARIRLDAASQAATADAASDATRDWLAFMGAVWGVSLIDTYFLTPGPGRVDTDITSLTFGLSPMSRGEAVLRSLVPGLGQYYAGRQRAGQVAFLGALASVTGLLMAEHAYEESLITLRAYEELYEDPLADPEEVEIFRGAVEDQSSTAKDHRDTRNILAGVTAGVWVANLVDAYLGTPSPPGSSRSAAGGKRPSAPGPSFSRETPVRAGIAAGPGRLGLRVDF
jgi:hypothetical protein